MSRVRSSATPGAPAWLRPTVRALPVPPLAGATGVALVLAVLAREPRFATAPRGVLEAVLAATVVAAMWDPAHALLSASPTSLLRRRWHRLVVVGPPVVALWTLPLVVARLDGQDLLGPGSTVGAVGALLALTGAAVAVVLAVPGPVGVTLGTVVAVVWGTAAFVVPPESADWLLPWLHHPWWACAVVSVLLLIVAPRSRR